MPQYIINITTGDTRPAAIRRIGKEIRRSLSHVFGENQVRVVIIHTEELDAETR